MAEPSWTPEDPLVAANTMPNLCISTPHPDGGATTRIWCVTAEAAERIADMLGEAHVMQLVTGEQMAAMQPIISEIPAVFGEATGQ
ncbi:MAG TPA: hypothetical protein VIP77_15930 [Jiangellaceae bacterium]